MPVSDFCLLVAHLEMCQCVDILRFGNYYSYYLKNVLIRVTLLRVCCRGHCMQSESHWKRWYTQLSRLRGRQSSNGVGMSWVLVRRWWVTLQLQRGWRQIVQRLWSGNRECLSTAIIEVRVNSTCAKSDMIMTVMTTSQMPPLMNMQGPGPGLDCDVFALDNARPRSEVPTRGTPHSPLPGGEFHNFKGNWPHTGRHKLLMYWSFSRSGRSNSNHCLAMPICQSCTLPKLKYSIRETIYTTNINHI